jgi:hypothetical protein
MAQNLTQYNPAPSGVTATYFGSVTNGTTTRYYWIQAIYQGGKSLLSQAPALASTPASLDTNNRVLVEWYPSALAIGYNIYYTTTSTPPTGAALATTFLASVTAPNFTDKGISNSPAAGFVVFDGFRVARARYEFDIDGDPLAPGLITLANSDTIPNGAIIVGATLYTSTAFAGATNVGVGTSAGSSATSIKASTAIASLTGAVNGSVTFAAPVHMTAAGTVTITSTVAALTAGVMDILIYYVMGINP